MLSLFETSLFAASLTLFLNYIIGKPGGNFSAHEIFSSYTVWLSKMRLKKLGLWDDYAKQFGNIVLYRPSSKADRENEKAILAYTAAEPYFTWERAVGMCSVCTGFWIALIVALVADFRNLPEIIVFSHIIIRVLNKIL